MTCIEGILHTFPLLFQVGDPTLSVLELWGAEYQESNALLLRSKDSEFLRAVCNREKCPVDFVGKITGDGKVSKVVFSPLVHVVCARIIVLGVLVAGVCGYIHGAF